MPKEIDTCKFYTFDLSEDEKPIIGCEKGHKADGKCITEGKPECPSYEKGIAYSWEEVKQRLGLK